MEDDIVYNEEEDIEDVYNEEEEVHVLQPLNSESSHDDDWLNSDSSSIIHPDDLALELEQELVFNETEESSTGSETFKDMQTCLGLSQSESETDEDEKPFSKAGDCDNNSETKPLFSGSGLNKLQIICLLLRMYVQHKMSFKTMDSFLKLFNFALPQPNCIPKSWYRMRKFISAYFPKVIIFFCLILVGKRLG